MQLALDVIIFILSFVLIFWGGGRFVDSCVAIAKKLKMPTVLVGATLTSIGTTLPELLVTIFSSTSNASGMAVGNALGSVIFNSCIIGGVLLCAMQIKIKKSVVSTCSILIFLVTLLSVMCLNKNLSAIESSILIVTFVIFMVVNYLEAKKSVDETPQNQLYTKKMWQYFLLFLISAAAIGFGAFLMVEKAKLFCYMAGLSETFVGIAILSFGTSLPELITTITAVKKKEANLGIGNIVGSNVINCGLLLGLTGLINAQTGLAILTETLIITIPIALFCTFSLFVPTLINKKTYKWQGIMLITLYVAYYVYLLLSGLGAIKIII